MPLSTADGILANIRSRAPMGRHPDPTWTQVFFAKRQRKAQD